MSMEKHRAFKSNKSKVLHIKEETTQDCCLGPLLLLGLLVACAATWNAILEYFLHNIH